jgi:predicted ferric reductase
VLARRRPTPRWWADAAGGTAGLTLVLVAGLWTRDGGLQDLFGDPAAALSSMGRLTGLLASDLLLLQVLLMARIPLAERAFGQDQLARWHRWTGFASLHLMLGHIALITAGYALAQRSSILAEWWDLTTNYPGMLLATGGTVALILVVVTSVRAARRRLRYESWHLLHLYAYLGVGLALPHQLWTGTDFLTSPVATAFWWTLYALAAGSVLIFRIGLPAWRNGRHRLTVSHVVREGPGLTSVYLRGRALHRLPVRAGQFFLWRFLDGSGWSRAHPYSLSAAPSHAGLRVTVKDLGDGSGHVASLRPGTRALIEGPYGSLTGDTYHGGPLLLLGCGIGVTPLLSLLGELPYRPGEATLVYRVRSEAELAFRTELEWFAQHRGVRVVYLVGPRARPGSWLPRSMSRWNDVAALRWIAPQIALSHVYLCGPDAWMEAAARAADAAGAQHVHAEQFAW